MPQRPAQHHPSHYRPYVEPQRPSPTAQGYGSEWRKIRARVLREESACYICGGPGRPDDQVEHVTPKARGGTNDRNNLRRVHHACHSVKTAKEDGGFGNPTR